MKIVRVDDFKQFSAEKMKKNNLFQTARFFCDVYGFEPGQARRAISMRSRTKCTSS